MDFFVPFLLNCRNSNSHFVVTHTHTHRMVKIQNKLEKAVGCLEYFTTHQWRFTDDNVRELLTHMSVSDRSTFPFDVTQIDWDAYFERYVLGLRAFLCKQNPKTLPSCRKKMTRYQNIKYNFFIPFKNKSTK